MAHHHGLSEPDWEHADYYYSQKVDRMAIKIVHPDLACPNCGENRMGWINRMDDETVQCAACGCKYKPEIVKRKEQEG